MEAWSKVKKVTSLGARAIRHSKVGSSNESEILEFSEHLTSYETDFFRILSHRNKLPLDDKCPLIRK